MTPAEYEAMRSEFSDEDLERIAAGTYTSPGLEPGQVAAGSKAASVREEMRRPTVKPDASQGMSGLELALAGAGGELQDIGSGLKEKLQLAFRPEGDAGREIVKEIAKNRAERAAINKQLYSNPEAVAGKFGANAVIGAATPARIGAQMATQGMLEAAKPGTEAPQSVWPELVNSALHGGVSAGATGVVGKGLGALGRTIGAARGNLTEEGASALATKKAASDLGLSPTGVEQLYPNSTYGRIMRTLPGYEDRVINQARELAKRLDEPMHTPEGDVPDVGRKFVGELANAAENRLRLGADKYKAVDEFIEANGLGNFKPMYTARAVTNTNNPGYEVASDLLTRYGFDAKAVAGQNASELGKADLSFANFHTMRTAANKALSSLDRGIATAERMGTPIPAENRAARKFLSDFKTALDSDAERWAAKHKSNEDALDLYRDATKYYREVVAPTVLDNPVARKAMSRRSPYRTGHEGLAATTSEAGSKFVDRLIPTMGEEGLAMNTVLRGLPDVRKQVLSPDPTSSSGLVGLYQLSKGVLAPPLKAVQTALSPLSESEVAARLMGAKNELRGSAPSGGGILRALQQGNLRQRVLPEQGVLPRAAWGMAQYPSDELTRKTGKLGGLR